MERVRSAASLLIPTAILIASLAAAPSAMAGSLHTLQTRMSPTGTTAAAWAKVTYKVTAKVRRLTVETHGLDPGTYDVLVGGGPVGSMDVIEGVATGEGSGRLVLDSRSAGRLIFDPRGTSVEIVNQATGMVELDVDEFPSNQREEMARTKIGAPFKSTDVQPAASGESEFRSFKGRSTFVVRVAGLSPGLYDLMVGGTTQAQLSIPSLDEVEVTFDTIPQPDLEPQTTLDPEGYDEPSPASARQRLLTFDPRGFAISISRGGVDLLAIHLFPY